ncbi:MULTISPECIES: hypothetical protein [unclassified Sporosarcina]|uniref:hypothetical protein n=1 Tax=unclassified Sporosarcina TaxID=2647733 RepID=UPI001A93A3D0|nr:MULTISPECIES: hypothetical protein [unclassified Sporosarcina]MBO0588203.1 hypothetical protein [Sporosarcina sp. E16_8]MBO0601957.1 hypothetical protein [Sporosarcina sp. E16_3]
MDYQIVKNRMFSELDDQEFFLKSKQVEILNAAENGLNEDSAIYLYLDAVLSNIEVAEDKNHLIGLQALARDLRNSIEDIESLKPFQYDLFQSGLPLDSLKDCTELDVVAAINGLSFPLH